MSETPDYEPTIYHPIHSTVFSGPVSKDYVLEGCGRCGAAVPADGVMRGQHEKWHASLERNTNTMIVIQLHVRRLLDWIKEFERLNK